MVRLEHLRKRFPAGGLEDLSLEVGGHELLALLGPSGCGKTTALRIVAGLLAPDAGAVWIDGADVTALPPERRSVGLVFQNYALFPHLPVADNVAYGLRARGVAASEVRTRVAEALDLVGLAALRSRRPDQLSGGEQQRVAVARALVIRPRVLLLDEPLSNLDAALRRRMRDQLREIQRAAGIPTIHVTHDQEEALAVADRLAVLEHGRLAQIGTPKAVFQRPASAFVARFLGGANVVAAVVVEAADGRVVVEAFGGRRIVVAAPAAGRGPAVGERASLALRPEAIDFRGPGADGLPARVVARTYLGREIELRVRCAAEDLTVRLGEDHPLATAGPGADVGLVPDPARAHLMPPETGAP